MVTLLALWIVFLVYLVFNHASISSSNLISHLPGHDVGNVYNDHLLNNHILNLLKTSSKDITKIEPIREAPQQQQLKMPVNMGSEEHEEEVMAAHDALLDHKRMKQDLGEISYHNDHDHDDYGHQAK